MVVEVKNQRKCFSGKTAEKDQRESAEKPKLVQATDPEDYFLGLLYTVIQY
jgi:hypothetical protein